MPDSFKVDMLGFRWSRMSRINSKFLMHTDFSLKPISEPDLILVCNLDLGSDLILVLKIILEFNLILVLNPILESDLISVLHLF